MHSFAPGDYPAQFEKDAALKRILLKFLTNESGATAVEYCLIAAAIALAIIGLVKALGINIAGELASINSQLK